MRIFELVVGIFMMGVGIFMVVCGLLWGAGFQLLWGAIIGVIGVWRIIVSRQRRIGEKGG